jgi:hypothetical protein
MRSRFLGLGLAAAVFAGISACDESLSSLTGPTPNLTPTFTSIQTEIFNTTDSSGRTACVNCHNSNGRTPSGGLDLTSGTSYSRLVNVVSGQRPPLNRVTPGDPENSYIVHKLEGRPSILGGRMPRGTGPFLTDGQMLVIRRWIELGAPNN